MDNQDAKKLKKSVLSLGQLLEVNNLFIGMPMGSSPENFFNLKPEIDKFSDFCTCEFGINILFHGKNINEKTGFSSKYWTNLNDFANLKLADAYYFVLPQRVATGTLVEIGWALAGQKPVFFFVKDTNDLPHIIRKIPNNSNVKIEYITFNTSQELYERFVNTAESFFQKNI